MTGHRHASQESIDIKVTEAMAQLDNSCAKRPSHAAAVKNLPLVLFKHNSFIKSTSDFEGLTIGDRVEILRAGENITQISSCMRITSNWLASSAYKYLTFLDMTPHLIFICCIMYHKW